jgi:peptidylprolyl isomerase
MQAESNSRVKVHYTGKLADGTVFDSSQEGEPLEFTIGTGQIIPGFENAIQGMSQGEKKTVEVAPDQAYGQVRQELIQQVDRSEIPEDIPLEPGLQLQAESPDGQVMLLRVADIGEDKVTLDANHPLAGKTLTFDIELVEVA